MNFSEIASDPCSTVSQAAREGQLERLRELIAQGHPVDVSDNRGWKAIHEASYGNHALCLQELLGIETTNVNWKAHDGATALLVACQERNVESARLLLSSGADPNLADDFDNYPLLEAVKANCMNIVCLLISHGANVNCQLYCGTSPLHQAASEGMLDMVKYLLQHNARLDIEEDYNITPIFSAAQFGKHKCLEVLLQHAQETGQRNVLNHPAVDGATPLYLAAQEGHVTCVRLLLRYGADPNMLTMNEPRALPLLAALEFARVECVQELVVVTDQRCLADCDTSPWYTLFCLGDYKMRYRLGRILLDAGFDPNYQHAKDLSDEHARYPKILRFLPTAAMLFYKCIRPLTRASYFEAAVHPSKLVQLLLDKGAFLNAQSLYELAPIIPALENAKMAIIEKLLSHGVEMNVYHPKIHGNLSVLLSLHRWKSFNFLLRLGVETQSLFNEAKYFHCLEQYKRKLSQWRQNRVTNENAASSSENETDTETSTSTKIEGGAQIQRDMIESIPFIPFSTFLMGARPLMNSGPYRVTPAQVLYRLVYFSSTVDFGDLMSFMENEKERQAIAALTETPRCLDHLARMRVRDAIGPQRLHNRQQIRQALDLPKNIIDYLYFQEFDDE